MLAAARLTAPPGSPVLAEYHQRKIDFLGETALFSIFTDFNLHVRLFLERMRSLRIIQLLVETCRTSGS